MADNASIIIEAKSIQHSAGMIENFDRAFWNRKLFENNSIQVILIQTEQGSEGAVADVATPSLVSGSELEQTSISIVGIDMICHMTGTSEHSVSIIEFDLGKIELHARNCSIAY